MKAEPMFFTYAYFKKVNGGLRFVLATNLQSDEVAVSHIEYLEREEKAPIGVYKLIGESSQPDDDANRFHVIGGATHIPSSSGHLP